MAWLAGGLSFLVFAILPGAALSLALFTRSSRPDATGDLFVALYLASISALLSTAGFLAATALGRRWRGLPWRRTATIGASLGLLSPLAHFAALAAGASALLPIIRSAPAVGTGLFYVLPGLVLGIAAILIARLAGERTSTAPARPRPPAR